MKIQHFFYQISEFFIILILFVLPSIFSKEMTTFTNTKEFFSFVIYLLFSIFLLLILNKKNKTEKKTQKKPILVSIVSLILLLWLSFIFSVSLPVQEKSYIKPSLFVQNLFFIPILVSFEEVLFRAYIPDKVFYLFTIKAKKQSRFIKLLAIVFSSLLFALAHSYAGFYSIIFAFLSSLILFVLKDYTSSLFFPILVHSLYNYFAFFYLLKT